MLLKRSYGDIWWLDGLVTLVSTSFQEYEKNLEEKNNKKKKKKRGDRVHYSNQKEETIKVLDSQIAALCDEIVKEVLPV
ncbi:hypothetical protein C5167_018908 [Papaver somniferum]|uniref:Uncharacterized protein n=1 Tax=Papaver somniferum TaxID=3469 RepID=A0A4Y7ISK3_PAPSO|nr:hypothetical protein C5167_018908 [Papaver somniferum]